MTSSASTATPMKHDFSRQVDEVRLPKRYVTTSCFPSRPPALASPGFA